MFGKSKKTQAPKVVNPDLTAKALAKAIVDGDSVNLRLLFQPFSPAREDSPERFETDKYAYLLPDAETESSRRFAKAMTLVRHPFTWKHIEQELHANRPAQMPSELVLLLADDAVREGKFTTAAQAYEVLRIRPRMQDEFYKQADAALDAEDVDKAVDGYLIASGLEYNYAAFPEPLPTVLNFQTTALMLHGVYPEKPEDCVALQEPETFVRTALIYLLGDAKAAARLAERPLAVRLGFLERLVYCRDPRWEEFVQRYRESCVVLQDFQARIAHASPEAAGTSATIAAEIEEILGEDPRVISSTMLGRTIPDGDWWQYLKELAYENPPAILFVSRQIIGEKEIIVPRYRGDSPIPPRLGLLPAPAGQTVGASG